MTTPHIIKVAERFSIAPMEESDLDQVLVLEQDSFPTPWGRNAFLGEIKTPFASCWVLLDGWLKERGVVGYTCWWEAADEVHLHNICVAKPYRGQGLGRTLMRFIISWAASQKKTVVKLEARQSNEPAMQLYRSLGFVEVGRRKDYYNDTGEDALLMDLNLTVLAGSEETD